MCVCGGGVHGYLDIVVETDINKREKREREKKKDNDETGRRERETQR